MALKNYTTSIKVEKTIAEVETMLVKAGATHIFKMYDKTGNPKALAFKTLLKDREISFKLPMEEEKILQIFNKAVSNRALPSRYRADIEQARRTGWRIIKDWIASQMAMIEINLVKIEEVFLPYMYDAKLDQTLYEKLEKQDFKLGIEYKEKPLT